MAVYNLSPGMWMYKYELLSPLGSSQADVWLARDDATDTQVAVKILDAVNAPVAKQLWEAKIGARFRHANLCEVLYADVTSIPVGSPPSQMAANFVLIAQKYYPNGACSRLLAGPGLLPPRSVHKLLVDVLKGLEYLHENGCYHNDIKPANILVGDHGEFVLTDYGIAWTAQNAGSQARFYKPHVAPETAAMVATVPGCHVPTVQTDLYQLGVTAYRLLNGVDRVRDDFTRLSETEFYKRVSSGKLPDRRAFAAWVPRNLQKIVRKAIAVDPTGRYQSALEMRRQLERVHIPYQWEPDAQGNMVYGAATADWRIETIPTIKKSHIVQCRRFFKKSNHSEVVHATARKCSSPQEIAAHTDFLYRWVQDNA